MTKLALYGYVRGFMLSVIFPLVLLPVWRFVFVYCLIAAAAFSSGVRLYNLVSKMFQYLINGLYNSHTCSVCLASVKVIPYQLF
jgi:hypothetical protein